MTPFSHLSFLRKLTLFVLAATVFALSMTFVALTLYERSSFRQTRRNELSLLASTLGQNSGASLVFNDQKTASDILAALQADPHIIAACLFDNRGRVFAEYPHLRPQGLCSLPATFSSGTAQFTSNSLSWYQDVFLDGDKCGSIVIVSDLNAFNRKIAEYIQIESLILLVAFLLTYFLSLRLLRIATDPILLLAELAGRVSSEKDYSLRAPRAGADEVGILTLSFNDMLDGIQQRDVALQAGRDELEVRVHERTEALRHEVSARVHTEEALSNERQVLRALIDNVPDLMYVKDTLSCFIVANTAVARAMGLHSSDELIGKNAFDFFPREFAASYYQNEQDVIGSKQPLVDHEEQTVTQTGHRIWLLTTKVPLLDGNGDVTGIAGVGHDITARKKTELEWHRAKEAAEAASRAKSEFLANMGHDTLLAMLEHWGMQPFAADGGAEALQALQAARDSGSPFQLILTDMHMPTMDGFDLVAHIRKQPTLCAATIMMLTSAGHSGDAERCRQLSVAAYLLKPVRKSELQEAIARVLGSGEPSGAAPLVTRLLVQGAAEAVESLAILVAEDNAVNQRLAVRLLEKRGHRVTVASNGQEALDALSRNSFDLVLMDVQMPLMDGLTATAIQRQRELESGGDKHVAIIALTAHAMKGDQDRCLAVGMDGYLTEPIRPPELDDVLAQQANARKPSSRSKRVTQPAPR